MLFTEAELVVYTTGDEVEDVVENTELVEGVYSGQAVLSGLHLVIVTVAVR